MSSSVSDSLLSDFLLESQERLAAVEESFLHLDRASRAERREALERARRELHTLKGNAGMMGLDGFRSLAHDLEGRVEALDPGDAPEAGPLLAGLDRLAAELRRLGERGEERSVSGGSGTAEPPHRAAVAPASVRVPFSAVDELVEGVSELLIVRNRLDDALRRAATELAEARSQAQRLTGRGGPLEDVTTTSEVLGQALRRLQERILHLGMLPVRGLFGQLERIVRDEGRRLGKEARMVSEGSDTRLDRALLEPAAEALGHLVRNAVVHGLEAPEERRAAGKPATGTVRLAAVTLANEVMIEAADDGQGIDRERLLEAARRRGLHVTDQEEVVDLIFRPGLSSFAEADLSAGRGVGLAAVHDSIQRRGGRIEVATKLGEGSSFRLFLPLAASMTRALLLRADGEAYALPVASVLESIPLTPERRHHINHAGVFRWRGQVLSLLDLGCALGTATRLRDEGFILVVRGEGRLRGLVCDEILGLREIVVKGLDEVLAEADGMLGSTILGDGRAALILDPIRLVQMAPFVEEVG